MTEGQPEEKPIEDSPETEDNLTTSKEIYLQRFREGRLGALIKTILADPETHDKFLTLFKDREAFKGSGLDLDADSQKVTPMIVALMRDKEMRALVVEAILSDMNDRSGQIKDSLKEVASLIKDNQFGAAPEKIEEAAVYNKIVVGAGVHAAIFNNRLTKVNPNVKSLTVEETDVVSANFRTKSFVSVNSPNQPHSQETPNFELQTGNLNFFGSEAPVQLPFIEPETYFTADAIADTATANQHLSGSEMLMETAVEHVETRGEASGSENWPALHKVTFADGTAVFANEVIFATGLGEEEYPAQFDKITRSIAERDRNKQENGLPPGIMTYDEFGRFFSESDTPLRGFDGKKVDLAGGGDGSATVAEALLRLGKREGYGRDVSQTGTPSKIHWVGQNIQDSQQYRTLMNNPRYLMLTREMPRTPEQEAQYAEDQRSKLSEKKIEPVNGHLVQIRDSDDPSKGRYRVTYSMREPKGAIEERYTDHIVLATGFKNRIGDVLGYENTNPFDDAKLAEAVNARFEDLDSSLPVAVKLKGKGIYAIGPSSISQVLVNAETKATGFAIDKRSHPVAIATFGPRSEKLADILGAEDEPHLKVLPSHENLLQLSKQPEGKSESHKIEAPKEVSKATGSYAEVRAKSIIGQIFEKCVVSDTDAVSIEFAHDINDKSAFQIRFTPSLKNEEEVLKTLQETGVLDSIKTISGGSRWKTIVDIPFNAAGKVKIPEINIRREANRV